jgi:hypothetical protein
MPQRHHELDDRRLEAAVHAVLADDCRRQLVEHLLELGTGTRRSIDDLVADLPPAERRETALRLHHVHLPKLETVGAVDYDADRNVFTVEPPIRLFDRLD